MENKPNEAIGVCARQYWSNKSDRRPLSDLDQSMLTWLEKAFKRARWSPKKTDKELAKWGPAVTGFYVSNDRVITRDQVTPRDSMLKGRAQFNHVDLYRPFINNLRSFRLAKDHTAVIVTIDLSFFTKKNALTHVELEPKLWLTAQPDDFSFPDGIAKPLGKATPHNAMLFPGAKRIPYRWTRTYSNVDDLKIRFRRDADAWAVGDIPVEVVEHDAGFCSWTNFTVTTPSKLFVERVEGTMELTFGYNVLDPEDATEFRNELKFLNENNFEWTLRSIIEDPGVNQTNHCRSP